jgi:hypothetical protein
MEDPTGQNSIDDFVVVPAAIMDGSQEQPEINGDIDNNSNDDQNQQQQQSQSDETKKTK